MKRFLTALFASCAVAFAIPAASAQDYRSAPGAYQNGNYGDWNSDLGRGGGDYYTLQRQIQRVDQGIWRGARDGTFTRREARRLSIEVRQLSVRLDAYSRNGLTPWERQDLQRGFARLRDHLRDARNDNYRGRDYGYGYGGFDPRLGQ